MVRTPWNTPDIWRRKSFNLPEEALSEFGNSPLLLPIHQDEDTEVFLNGEEVASMEGYTIGYSLASLSQARGPPSHPIARLYPELEKP